MTDSGDVTPVAIPWYKSNMMRGLVLIVVASTLKHFKIGDLFSQADVQTIVDDGLAVLGTIGVAIAAHARVTQKTAPTLTTSQGKADVINQGASK